MADFETTLTTFSAGDAEAITGVSAQLQRDWRRRGYLPPIEGKARFDVIALAELMAFKALGDRGIGPQVAQKSARIIALSASWAALSRSEAVKAEGRTITDKMATGIAKHVMRNRMPDPFPPYFIIFANGDEDWTADLGGHFSTLQNIVRFLSGTAPELADRLAGAVVVVDTYALGDMLLRRAARPLVTVTKI